MRRGIIIAVLLLVSATAHGQFKKGDGEMMLLGTVGAVTSTTKVTSNGSAESSETSSERMYLYIAVTPAYYFINGLSGELELGLRATKGSTPAESAVLYLSWTQRYRRSIAAWFLRAGYGRSNGISIPVYDDLNRSTGGLDVGIISGGAGLKIHAGGRALLRAEANYRLQMYTRELLTETIDYSTGTFALLLGVGIVL